MGAGAVVAVNMTQCCSVYLQSSFLYPTHTDPVDHSWSHM